MTAVHPPTYLTELEFFEGKRRCRKNAVPSSPSSSTTSASFEWKVIAAPTTEHNASSPIRSSIPPPSSSPATSSRSTPSSCPSSPPKKRKSLQPPEPEAVLVDPEPAAREPKRQRTASSSKGKTKRRKGPGWSKPFVPPAPSSRPRSLAPSIYRNSRSRSTSAFPSSDSETPIFKRQWRTDESGDPGSNHLSSEDVVKKLMKSYKAYFRNHDNPDDTSFEPENLPLVELEYPNAHAVERFLLLAPKDKDHYNPVYDLESTLCTMIEFYCTKEQQARFGPNPNDWRSEGLSPPPSRSPSPSPSTSSSRNPLFRPRTTRSTLPIIRAFKRAIHRHDGPAFMEAMADVNMLLRELKYPYLEDIMSPQLGNGLMAAPTAWTETGLPKGVLMRLIEENYQRTVGPNVRKLKRYEAFSSTVYGELMPNLVYEILKITNLNENSLFLDLGSGVGNVVVQASLQTGCRSFGIELMPEPARVAEDVVEQMRIRARMWGLRMGEVELEKGDMLKSKRVDELMPQADVVLVDNKVFEESLNEALKPKFLDLKEGAIVVSLAPFVSSLNARVTERNVDDITAIFDVTEREYSSGSVSWGNSGGSYYIHRVDRTGYAKIREQFENARAQMRPLRRRA
ncbi:histone-lysine N-methyltransferase [Coprinopsis cinerea okayama7|uniref:Histone-lysine N-methyltransferase, H3 lysine-79 specific n=1 Tax=Coprinopsis cinerea (strain Okayama-7 / 130 / ATCC MYA-4618 / FGSC 9003) TaxID=240176 RepID=A8N0W1_COPC7|nr:histone-lysine N-methyltransferase [Coprinopsis cinerea okayama7\|eukprot:XP_001828512.2 histone-lysine N-methyltransferase [Coprinopsis cinerea okayama7\